MSYKIHIIIGLFITLISAFPCLASRVTYLNYRLYRVHLATYENATEVGILRDTFDSLLFVDHDLVAGNDVHIVVAPHMVPEIEYGFDNRRINYTLVNRNLQSLLIDSDPQDEMNTLIGYDFDGESYVTLNTTYGWLSSLQNRYPDTLVLFAVGKSTENRPILGVEISRKTERPLGRKLYPADTGTNIIQNKVMFAGFSIAANVIQYLIQTKKESIRPGIFIEAGIHGNDWISSATASYIIHQLLENPLHQGLTMMYDWFIVPHANPDGYEYSGTTDRLWPKSRSPNGPCFGVDLNRNFDAGFPSQNNRDALCLNNYQGSSPFSEKESSGLKESITSLKQRVRLYIALHGDYKFAIKPATNTQNFDQIVTRAYQTIGENFSSMSNDIRSSDIKSNYNRSELSSESGSSVKWVYEKLGIASFNIQLGMPHKSISKNKNAKIARPASEIIPIGEKAFKAIIALLSEVKVSGLFDMPK